MARLLPCGLPEGDALRRAMVTAAVASLFLVVAPVYALAAWLFERPPSAFYVLAIETVVGCIGALVWLRRGRVAAASWLLLVTGTSATAITTVLEGPGGQAAGNMVLPVVRAALLVDWRGGARRRRAVRPRSVSPAGAAGCSFCFPSSS